MQDTNLKRCGRKTVSGELVSWEIKKLWEMPVLRIFLVLCTIFNILLVTDSWHSTDYIAYVKEARKTAGSRMGKTFDEKVRSLADCAEKERLIQETAKAEDLFETYDPAQTAEMYIDRYQMTGWAADALRKKFEKQKPRIQTLARQDASMDAGAAGMTKPLMDLLFEKLCRAVLTEGLLLAVFSALYICGIERTERTWLTVYASKRGRRVQTDKFLAGLFYALTAYAVIAAVSCAAFACIWQLGDIWNTDVCTQFYYVTVMAAEIPFVTWIPFTMCSYLAAVLLSGMAVSAVFYILGYVTGLAVQNSYAGFIVLAAACALNFEAVLLAGNQAYWGFFEAAMWTPVMLWWMQPLWFTDMGMHAVVPWQECWVFLLCLTAAVSFLYLGFRYFDRKDLK